MFSFLNPQKKSQDMLQAQNPPTIEEGAVISRWLFHLHSVVKIRPSFQFSPWRASWLRHFVGYSLGASRKKASTFFYASSIVDNDKFVSVWVRRGDGGVRPRNLIKVRSGWVGKRQEFLLHYEGRESFPPFLLWGQGAGMFAFSVIF